MLRCVLHGVEDVIVCVGEGLPRLHVMLRGFVGGDILDSHLDDPMAVRLTKKSNGVTWFAPVRRAVCRAR